jgi:hypothetical protein
MMKLRVELDLHKLPHLPSSFVISRHPKTFQDIFAGLLSFEPSERSEELTAARVVLA